MKRLCKQGIMLLLIVIMALTIMPVSASAASASESTASETENIASASESTVSAPESTTSETESTVSASESTVSKTESIACASESTVSETESIACAPESTVSESESTVSETESTVSESESTTSALESTVSASESTASGTESTVGTSESTLAITTQPQDVTADVGDTVSFTVKATGSGLTYQWQYSTDSGTTWKTSSNKTAKCSVSVTESKDGYQYRCVVTDENGDTVTSDAATLSITSISITVQPEDWTGSAGSKVYFTVEATGTDLSYQWQISTNGGTTWSVSSVTGETYQATIQESYDGRLYRCMVYNGDGEAVYSSSATLTVSDTFAIFAQPEDQYGVIGEKANFYLQAGGTDVSYQWQESENGTSGWTNLDSATNPRLQLTVSASNVSMYYRCVITNGDGKTLTSTAARLLSSGQGFVSYGDSGTLYYVNEDGTLQTGFLTIGTDTYYFYSNGKMARGITRANGEHIYLDFETGVQQFGLIEVGVDWYMYFSESDGTAQTGLMEIDGNLYFFSEEESKEGVSESGLVEIDGSTYYFDSTTKQAVTGFVTNGDYTYYAGSDHKIVTGLQIIDGDLYYFADSGAMKYGMVKASNGIRYYFDEETGKAITGFLTVANGKVYYFDGVNGGLTGLQEIDGKLYYLNSNSVVQYGKKTIDDCIYIFDSETGVALSGWGEYTGTNGTINTMYFDEKTHAAVTGFQEIDGETYYFSTSGYLKTGSITIDDTSYYFDMDTGALANGFVTRQKRTNLLLCRRAGISYRTADN